MKNETAKTEPRISGETWVEKHPSAIPPLPRRGHTLSAGGGRILEDVVIHDLTSQHGSAFAVVEYENGVIKTLPASNVRFGPKPGGAA